MELNFYKYQGTGNDFVMVDNRGQNLEEQLTADQVKWLCDRHFGIGADGLILLSEADDPRKADFKMIYYNSDGRESTMCGNGGRCLVAFAHRLKAITLPTCSFEAIDGLHRAEIDLDGVALEMMNPQGLTSVNQDDWWVDTGSPHYVRFESGSVDDVSIQEQGKSIRWRDDYRSIGGTNVNFVEILDEGKMKVRTFERGVEGETLSCGTGVTAAAFTYLKAFMSGESSDLHKVHIQTPGGQLQVEIQNFGLDTQKVVLKGPATFVFEGQIRL